MGGATERPSRGGAPQYLEIAGPGPCGVRSRQPSRTGRVPCSVTFEIATRPFWHLCLKNRRFLGSLRVLSGPSAPNARDRVVPSRLIFRVSPPGLELPGVSPPLQPRAVRGIVGRGGRPGRSAAEGAR